MLLGHELFLRIDLTRQKYDWLQVKAPTTWPNFTPVGGKLFWQSFNDWTPSADDRDTLAMNGLSEQISVTRDNTDYLWYMTE